MDRLLRLLKVLLPRQIKSDIDAAMAAGAVEEARMEFSELKAEVSRLRVAIERLERQRRSDG